MLSPSRQRKAGGWCNAPTMMAMLVLVVCLSLLAGDHVMLDSRFREQLQAQESVARQADEELRQQITQIRADAGELCGCAAWRLALPANKLEGFVC